jgi:hypothetical protein
MKVKMGDFVLTISFSDSNPIEFSGVRLPGNEVEVDFRNYKGRLYFCKT